MLRVFFSELLENLFLTPLLFLFLALLGLGISKMWKKLGWTVSAVSLSILLLLCIPSVTSLLMSTIQYEPPLAEHELRKTLSDVDALVILGGGRRTSATEYNQDTVSALTLERVRYAAWIAKRTGLPLIVSGGKLGKELKSEAELIQEVLQKEFVVIVDYVEGESRNTYENARYTTEILGNHKMNKIALVTHAWHMPRAKKAFKYFGVDVVAAPTAFYESSPDWQATDLVPSSDALYYSSHALHEIVGSLWYELRYY
jgi:uncharacterized SAM-binding protein YcdF (DUF218 family)